MNALEALVKYQDKCDELLKTLHWIARDINPYECGLPIYNHCDMDRLREAVHHWASGELEVKK